MFQSSDAVYQKFYEDAKVVKSMALSTDTCQRIDYAGQYVNVELLATLMKFIHLVEFFKKISQELASRHYKNNYALLNSDLDAEERELITDIFEDRNRIAHMISEEVLVNPLWETRAVFDMTTQLENITTSYLKKINQ